MSQIPLHNGAPSPTNATGTPKQDDVALESAMPKWAGTTKQGDKLEDILTTNGTGEGSPLRAQAQEVNRGPPSMANICAPWEDTDPQEAPKTITESFFTHPPSPQAREARSPHSPQVPKDDGEASATQEPSEDKEVKKDGPADSGDAGKDDLDFAAQLKDMEKEYQQKIVKS